MKKLFIVLLMLFVTFSYSQDEYNHNYYWNFQDNTKAIVGFPTCYVRKSPNIKSIVLDSLQLGTEVLVKSTSESLHKMKGINVSWVDIEYKNQAGETKIGFVWKGLLALNYVKNASLTYLTTIDKIEKIKSQEYFNENFFITVKILDKENQLLGENSIKKCLSESSYFQNKTIGHLGLSQLQNIYRISFSGEACGIPTFHYYFGWNGSKLLTLPEKMNVADADVYYHSEEFLFPSEKGGKPDMIIKKTEEAELIEETDHVYDMLNEEEYYKWNGEKATFINKSKARKTKKKL
jgi:hypothetical protein